MVKSSSNTARVPILISGFGDNGTFTHGTRQTGLRVDTGQSLGLAKSDEKCRNIVRRILQNITLVIAAGMHKNYIPERIGIIIVSQVNATAINLGLGIGQHHTIANHFFQTKQRPLVFNTWTIISNVSQLVTVIISTGKNLALNMKPATGLVAIILGKAHQMRLVKCFVMRRWIDIQRIWIIGYAEIKIATGMNRSQMWITICLEPDSDNENFQSIGSTTSRVQT